MTGQTTGYQPRVAAGSPTWAVRLVQDIVDWVEWKFRGPFRLTRYTVSTLPTLSITDAGATAWVTDDATYARQCWWNGSAWKRSDNTTVA